jgi:hypothetical protein
VACADPLPDVMPELCWNVLVPDVVPDEVVDELEVPDVDTLAAIACVPGLLTAAT